MHDNDADFAPLEPEYAAFEDHIWPLLAERIPGFEALRMQGAWADYYEMNTFDHNALVGLHPACDNLVFANGFRAMACSGALPWARPGRVMLTGATKAWTCHRCPSTALRRTSRCWKERDLNQPAFSTCQRQHTRRQRHGNLLQGNASRHSLPG